MKCNSMGSISEGLVGGQEGEAFARGVVVALDGGLEEIGGQGSKVGLAWELVAHAPDGVFDAALLPRFVGVAEESGQAQMLGELVVLGELGAIVESDGLAQGGRQRFKHLKKTFEDRLSGFIGLAGEA